MDNLPGTSILNHPNNSLLATGAWMEKNVDAANQVIIDARSAANYAAGHIKNAINLPPSALNVSATTQDLHPPAAAAAILGAAGVSNAATIIVYGADVDANAGRVFWALEYLGAADVRVLDGGYAKWTADGRATVTAAATLPPAVFTAAADAAKLATKASVQANYAGADHIIIDSRDAVHYTIKHIPNAINMLIGDFLNADKTVLSRADLKILLDSRGVTAGKQVITYCHTGYRSGQVYFILRLMGFNVSNYDGSWAEWSADTTLPATSIGKSLVKKILGSLAIAFGAVFFIAAGIIIVPNAAGNHIISEAKAEGYVAYKPTEAYDLANRICTQCHTAERIKRYCMRCGPPFIVLVPHMQTFIQNYRASKPGLKIENITESQAAVIVQVWNALVGNWEADFREADIIKMLGDYEILKALYKIPPEKRYIEMALMGRDDLKIGYMADMKKNGQNPENADEGGHEHTTGHDHGH